MADLFATSMFRKFRGIGTFYVMNIAGLSLATAVTLLCGLFVFRELTADHYHSNIRNIHAVSLDGRSNTPFTYGEALKNQLPGINSYTRVQLWDMKFNVLRYDENPPIDIDQIIRADTNFFNFFTFRFKRGDPNSCLSAPESLVLTESSSRKIFGSIDAIGKPVSYNKGQMLLTVTGVVEDPPPNSSLQFNAVMSVRSLPKIYPPFTNPGPFYWNFETFVSFDGVKADDRHNSVASDIFRQVIPVESIKEAQDLFKSKFEIRFIPYSKIHFHTGYQTYLHKGDKKPVYLFSVIGFLVMLVAVINFINLSNAASTLRFREAIIRKVHGANPRTLFLKYICESILMCFISVSLGLLIAGILISEINRQQIFSVPLQYFGFREILIILTGASVLFGVLAGAYPSSILVSLKPSITASHNNVTLQARIRKILLVLQFFISSGLIISTLVISKQYNHLTQTYPGFNAENIVCLRMTSSLKKNYVPFVNRLKESAYIESIANARYGFIGGRGPASVELVYRGNPVRIDAIQFTTDTGFMEMLGIQLIKGHSLREHDNISHKLIINEKAMEAMSYSGDPGEITMADKVHNVDWTVVGVMKDFNARSMELPVSPYIIYYVPGDPDMDGLYIKLKKDDPFSENTINHVKSACLEFSPEEPVSLEFLDNARAMLYREDDNRRKLFVFFSLFAVLISCLGLYALAGFILAGRTREIGIRKVYGAEKKSITCLLASDFLKIVFAGYLISLPVIWYLMSRWLQKFSLKTDLSWWIFGLAGLIILVISLLTLWFEIKKATGSNPVDIIRYE